VRQWIADSILPAAEYIRGIVYSIPMTAVRALVFGILAALALWVLSLEPQTLPEEKRGAFSFMSDLRFFAILALGLQALLYIIF